MADENWQTAHFSIAENREIRSNLRPRQRQNQYKHSPVFYD
ncbi:hypothetical protein [Azospirillum argentinense]